MYTYWPMDLITSNRDPCSGPEVCLDILNDDQMKERRGPQAEGGEGGKGGKGHGKGHKGKKGGKGGGGGQGGEDPSIKDGA